MDVGRIFMFLYSPLYVKIVMMIYFYKLNQAVSVSKIDIIFVINFPCHYPHLINYIR